MSSSTRAFLEAEDPARCCSSCDKSAGRFDMMAIALMVEMGVGESPAGKIHIQQSKQYKQKTNMTQIHVIYLSRLNARNLPVYSQNRIKEIHLLRCKLSISHFHSSLPRESGVVRQNHGIPAMQTDFIRWKCPNR